MHGYVLLYLRSSNSAEKGSVAGKCRSPANRNVTPRFEYLYTLTTRKQSILFLPRDSVCNPRVDRELEPPPTAFPSLAI